MVWTMAFVYVGEIYPTLWRSTGSGLASGAARIGSMIAPQLVFTNPSLRKVFNHCLLFKQTPYELAILGQRSQKLTFGTQNILGS